MCRDPIRSDRFRPRRTAAGSSARQSPSPSAAETGARYPRRAAPPLGRPAIVFDAPASARHPLDGKENRALTDLSVLARLHGREPELNHFPPDHIAEIKFPEPAKSREGVDQKLETEPAPQC